MTLPAARRRQIRQLTGTMLVSLGTAVFAGAVSIIIDGFVKGGALHWAYLAGFLAAGVALSGGGAWLLATIRAGVGLAIAATDSKGFVDRYQDEAETFARFGAGIFTAQSTLQIPVGGPEDLPHLRNRLLAGIRTLTQVERGATSVGLLFQGRLHVGFHVGEWLNMAGRRIDLYTDIRDGDGVSHLRAIRLGPTPQASPRNLDLALYRREGGAFTDPTPVTVADIRTSLVDVARTPMALAINLNGPVDEANFIEPVLMSAVAEGVSTTIIAALPAAADEPDSPARKIGPSMKEYESTISALTAVAKRMPAIPGLLYLKGPAVVSVALGRFLYDTGWIPMRYGAEGPGSYDRFLDSS